MRAGAAAGDHLGARLPSRAWAVFLDGRGYLERPPAAACKRLLPAERDAGGGVP